jgi:transcriptional regulator with XRE-family HTH domain
MEELPAWAVRLKHERRARGWSQKELARRTTETAARLHVSMPERASLIRSIGNWEAGRYRPRDPYPLLLSRVFDVDEAELFGDTRQPVPAAAAASIAPDSDLYERITESIEEPRRVDAATVEWLERCLAEHRRVEDTVGGRPLLPVVRAQLETVATLARGASGPLADRMVAMLGQYAQFIAWMCQDTGDHATALAWYDRSHGWALEAGDASLAATTLNMRAHLAWSIGDAPRCVRLAEASRWHDGRTTLGVQGMAAQMAARGHAEMGEAKPARRLLGEAEELIRAAAERPEDEPPWMYFYGDGWFEMQRGMAELALGDAARAVEFLERGLSRLPESYRRDRAWFGTCLARAHAAAGDVEAAETIALAVAPDAVAVNHFARRDLGKVAKVLRAVRPQSGIAVEEALRAIA